MQQDLFEIIKENVSIVDVLDRFTGLRLNRNKQVCCPLHHEKTPSCTIYPDTNSFHCFGCGKSGDQIKFVALLKNVDNKAAAEIIAEQFNINKPTFKSKSQARDVLKTNVYNVDKQQTATPSEENLKEIKNYVAECQCNAMKTDFFFKRGLNKESIQHFRLGYDPKTNEAVFPYNKEGTYYQTRKVNEKEFKKPPTNIAGAEPIYNQNILLSKDIDPIFVVESPICAISIWQCGGKAIALGGTSGVNKLIEFVKKHKPAAPLMLCLDNDEPGKTAQNKLDDEFEKLGIVCVPFNVADECKDPNELLLKDKMKLKKNVGLGYHAEINLLLKEKNFHLQI